MYIYDVMSILIQVPFLGAFVKVRKADISLIFSVYLFVCPQWKSSAPTGRIFMKVGTSIFPEIRREGYLFFKI
jgi:hypothetical protein